MSVERITPPEAHAEMTDSGVAYVDVRSQREFAAGHPAGAYNIPLMDVDPASGQMAPNPAFVSAFQAHFPADQRVIVACQAGGRSLRAAEALHAAGHTAVVDMAGGWGGGGGVAGWSTEGLPAEDGDGGDRSWPTLSEKSAS